MHPARHPQPWPWLSETSHEHHTNGGTGPYGLLLVLDMIMSGFRNLALSLSLQFCLWIKEAMDSVFFFF